jgi:hypothetical protein
VLLPLFLPSGIIIILYVPHPPRPPPSSESRVVVGVAITTLDWLLYSGVFLWCLILHSYSRHIGISTEDEFLLISAFCCNDGAQSRITDK